MDLPKKDRPSLEGQRFQVVVIGGGIQGAAIALECARAKRSTLLVEQHDFGAGSTSRSTRIVHGGLRYLEHGEIGLVRESLRERERLLRDRPHLVHATQFLLALGETGHRSARKIRLGLWLYRRMGGRADAVVSGTMDTDRFERLLDSGQRWSLFSFEDAQCEFPERLVAEWVVEAAEAGAAVRNHTQVLVVDVAYGRAKGVLVRDLLTGKEARVEANWVINATGPWADRLCQRSSINTAGPMVGGVRGSHIVLPRFSGAPDAPVLTEAGDGRSIFLVPWNEQIMVGTTEVPDRGDPGKTQASAEEVDYLLDSVRALLPAAQVSRSDIRYAFAGVRPLAFAPKKNPSEITRRSSLHDHSKEGVQRLISVIGGRLTTAAQTARECVRKMTIPVAEPADVMAMNQGMVRATLDELLAEIAAGTGLSEHAAQSIVEWHGRRALAIGQLARKSAPMRATLCPHSEHIVAEVVDAFEREYAATLGDALLRRVPVALGACWSEECSRASAARIAAALGWSEAQTQSEMETFEVERGEFLRKTVAGS